MCLDRAKAFRKPLKASCSIWRSVEQGCHFHLVPVQVDQRAYIFTMFELVWLHAGLKTLLSKGVGTLMPCIGGGKLEDCCLGFPLSIHAALLF